MRILTHHEIDSLLANHCEAEDWTQVFVSEGFSPEHVSHARFSGRIVMGRFEKTFSLAGGLQRHSGIKHVTLHNCEIGDNVLIENVANHISNYRIGHDTYIQNVNVIGASECSCFGNSIRVNVLNETGGREVPIYNSLSSSLAYILALYRHRPEAIEKLTELIEDYARLHSDVYGTIGHHVKIINTGTLKHVNIGDYAKIVNTSRLENGTIISNQDAPSYVGDNVIARDFIFASGASVAEGASVMRCFVGQACHLSHHFSAHDSLLFSNGRFENGEVCAIFAGPYTVSVHKSSLLIAGMFSFLNAGSGSNQSNHMYKLGPIHQGIVERGSKTTSDSYVLWPAKIGPFSLIMGRHYRHPDTSEMPFSYLIEKADETYLIPGVNLRSVGIIRDAQKWPKRDLRTDKCFLDHINYQLLSPFTVQKMINGKAILKGLQELSGEQSEVYTYRSSKIKNSSLRNGIQLYQKAIVKFFGNSFIARIQKADLSSLESIRKALIPTHPSGKGEWVDLSGLFAPKNEIDRILDKTAEGIFSLQQVEQAFVQLHRDYYDMVWTWAYDKIQAYWNISFSDIQWEEIISIVERWQSAVIEIDQMLLKDAQKEFSITSMTSFGVDGGESEKVEDFESVRGEFENNPFVLEIYQHIQEKQKLASDLLAHFPRA